MELQPQEEEEEMITTQLWLFRIRNQGPFSIPHFAYASMFVFPFVSAFLSFSPFFSFFSSFPFFSSFLFSPSHFFFLLGTRVRDERRHPQRLKG